MSSIIPVFGQGTQGKSVNVTAQRRINLYAEQSDDKAQTVYYGRPGLVRGFLYVDDGGYDLGGPIRGMHTTRGSATYTNVGRVYAVQGTQELLATTNTGFVSGPPDRILSSVGPVLICNLEDEVLAVDGVTGYLLHNSTNLDGTDFPNGARSCCAIAGRFVVDDPAAPGRFRWSGLNDITDWDPLNYATAESSADPLAQVFERAGELLLFGDQTLEFWNPTGADDVFARIGGAGIDWGLAVFDTVRKARDLVLFLGREQGGDAQVCMLRGYQVQVVSTADISAQLNAAMKRGAIVTASVHSIAGHTWYVVNLDKTSLAYDITTGEWAEWQSDGSRYCGQYVCPYQGRAIVSDYRDGRVYYLDDSVITEDGQPIVREITSKHIFNNTDRLCVDQVAMDAEMGVGITSGQGSDPKVMMQISTDGGHTFGDEMWRTLGALGQYKARAVWNRLGRARDFVFRWRIADPVKVVIMNIAARIRP